VPRKHVEAMARRRLGVGPPAARQVRALQQLIGEGAWEDAALLAEPQRVVAETLGEPDGVLIVDGSAMPTRGGHAAGVAAQWGGATGKTDTCQAGGFRGSASRAGYTLLDRRLYLPEAWFDQEHAPLWPACRMPAELVLQTKAELGAARVEHLQQQGDLPATGLVCDEGVGRNQALLDRVDASGLW
jgi:SRSO17 transposase